MAETSRHAAHENCMTPDTPDAFSDRRPVSALSSASSAGRQPLETCVSVVLPCLDEAGSVARVVGEAIAGLRMARVLGEVIVVDNGSSDGSAAAAVSAGARVVREPRRGYGLAVRRGLLAARGDVIVIADADGSYDLRQLGSLVRRIAGGADLVVGTRLDGAIEAGAMPWLHRRLGTPLVNRLLARATGRRFRDSQSGFRAMSAGRLRELRLACDGMELASEMLLQAHAAGLRIEEYPVRYRRRSGASKLRPFVDGMRHFRLLLASRRGGHLTRSARYSSSS
jgi:glycosyltransferase involved in cell wall biosynthesis